MEQKSWRLSWCTVAPAFKTTLLIAQSWKAAVRREGISLAPDFAPSVVITAFSTMQPPKWSDLSSSSAHAVPVDDSVVFPPALLRSNSRSGQTIPPWPTVHFHLETDKSHTHTLFYSLSLSLFSVWSNPCKGQTADFLLRLSVLPLATMQCPLANGQKTSHPDFFYCLSNQTCKPAFVWD